MTLNFSIPKRQHRFLVGSNADDILNETGCIVELPSIEDVSDQIVIRGPQTQLSVGLQAVINKANAIAVETLDLSSTARASSATSSSHPSSERSPRLTPRPRSTLPSLPPSRPPTRSSSSS
jgi:hypothetical protein